MDVRFEIVFTIEAEEDIDELKASDRAKILDAIEIHLRYEPEKMSKSRIKRLQGLEWPQYRLRVEDLRVFYNVVYTVTDGVVEILAIKEKEQVINWLAEYGIGES
nr:type II toxin-antitoxin system RelE/ParE family toxin [Spirulina major]